MTHHGREVLIFVCFIFFLHKVPQNDQFIILYIDLKIWCQFLCKVKQSPVKYMNAIFNFFDSKSNTKF